MHSQYVCAPQHPTRDEAMLLSTCVPFSCGFRTVMCVPKQYSGSAQAATCTRLQVSFHSGIYPVCTICNTLLEHDFVLLMLGRVVLFDDHLSTDLAVVLDDISTNKRAD